MEDYSLLVDYLYCTGCHTCEVACKQEHHFPAGKEGGVRVMEMVHELPGGKVDVTYFPYFTAACSFCASRVKKGLLPACVQHCMAGILEFGRLQDLSGRLPAGRKVYLHTRRPAKGRVKHGR
jgi:Fe-S-cluster-containing dehydrogenase component